MDNPLNFLISRYVAKRSLLFRVVLLTLVIPMVLTSCVKDVYDLSKGVNTDIALGGDSLIFPIGNSRRILLSSILDRAGQKMIQADQTGLYSLHKKDSLQMNLAAIKPFSFEIAPIHIDPISVEVSNDTYPSLRLAKIIYELPTRTTEIKIDRFVATEVQKVYSAALRIPAKTHLRIDVKGLPAGIDSVFFDNYTVKLPGCLKFESGATNYKNEIILNRGFKVSEGFSKVFELEKFDFGDNGLELIDGMFNFAQQVSLSGSIYVKDVNATNLRNMQIIPSLTVDPIGFSMIEGKVTPNIVPITKNIALNLPKLLIDQEITLDIQNPVLILQAGNTLGGGIDVNVELIPMKNGAEIPDATVSSSLTIAAATKPGEVTWSNFLMAKDPTKAISVGYFPITIPNLPALLKKVPDDIVVKISPKVSGEKNVIDLASKLNQIDLKYDINIPFEFGEDFKIVYQDTVADLHSKLSEIIAYAKDVELIAHVENQIPLELDFEIIPLDKCKNIIQDIEITASNKINAGDLDGTARLSKINLGVKELVFGSLEKLDALTFKITASSNQTVAGMPIRATQYVSVALKARIPNGIQYKFK